jgi:hypothetical protein
MPCPLYVIHSLVEEHETVSLLGSGEVGVSLRPFESVTTDKRTRSQWRLVGL